MPVWSVPKSGVTPKQNRAKRHRAVSRAELDAKAEVRARDGQCRFPACGCATHGFALHVAHGKAKGAGGDPTGQRSVPSNLVYLCSARHLANPISLHQGTLQILPRSKEQGFGGPCTFLVRKSLLQPFFPDQEWGDWYEVGREVRRGEFAAFTPEQAVVLDWLATMRV